MTAWRLPILAGLAAILAAGPAAAQQDPVAKDLSTVIRLQDKPCGRVESYRKLGENDYSVVCRSGDRYRIKLDEHGRVTITPQ